MKLLFDLDLEIFEEAQRLYNGGEYKLAPRVVFLRNLLDDIVTKNKKRKIKEFVK